MFVAVPATFTVILAVPAAVPAAADTVNDGLIKSPDATVTLDGENERPVPVGVRTTVPPVAWLPVR